MPGEPRDAEYAAARWWGYPTLAAWRAETDENKAEVLAAHWWHCQNESYAMEMQRRESDPKAKEEAEAEARRKAQEANFKLFAKNRK